MVSIRLPVALAEAGFERIDEARAHVGAGGEAVDEDEHVLEIGSRVVVGLGQLEDLAAAKSRRVKPRCMSHISAPYGPRS